MLHYTTGTQPQLPRQIFERMGQYRREVFIDRLGWALNTVNGMELDEFDGPDALYVCTHDDDDMVNGTARLLPTTGPYLLEKVFPQLWSGSALPHDPQVWELSRFATSEFDKTPANAEPPKQTSSAPDLLRRVISIARTQGAHTMITVTTVSLERLLRQKGFRARRTGLPVIHLGTAIVGLSIELRTDETG